MFGVVISEPQHRRSRKERGEREKAYGPVASGSGARGWRRGRLTVAPVPGRRPPPQGRLRPFNGRARAKLQAARESGLNTGAGNRCPRAAGGERRRVPPALGQSGGTRAPSETGSAGTPLTSGASPPASLGRRGPLGQLSPKGRTSAPSSPPAQPTTNPKDSRTAPTCTDQQLQTNALALRTVSTENGRIPGL